MASHKILAALLIGVAISIDPDNEFDYLKAAAAVPSTKSAKKHFTNIVDGSFNFFLTMDCAKIISSESPFGMDSTCWAQNPDAPYGLIFLPVHTGETIDAYTGQMRILNLKLVSRATNSINT